MDVAASCIPQPFVTIFGQITRENSSAPQVQWRGYSNMSLCWWHTGRRNNNNDLTTWFFNDVKIITTPQLSTHGFRICFFYATTFAAPKEFLRNFRWWWKTFETPRGEHVLSNISRRSVWLFLKLYYAPLLYLLKHLSTWYIGFKRDAQQLARQIVWYKTRPLCYIVVVFFKSWRLGIVPDVIWQGNVVV